MKNVSMLSLKFVNQFVKVYILIQTYMLMLSVIVYYIGVASPFTLSLKN